MRERNDSREERLSRLLSYVLRHKPEEFGIELEENGWVSMIELVKAVSLRQSSWRDLTVEDVLEAIDACDRPRFEVSDNERVRARYGHSIQLDLGYEPADPPEFLYHGGRGDRIEEIMAEGLKPVSRSYVHLSTDLDTATEVGRRRDYEPAILRIKAKEAAAAGHEFYKATDEVYLTRDVPPDFIEEA